MMKFKNVDIDNVEKINCYTSQLDLLFHWIFED